MTIERKNRILYIIWNIFAICIVALIVCAHIPRVANKLTRQQGFYGDMHKINQVNDFKISIPIVRSLPQAPIKKAKIIMIGDSFFNANLGSAQFAALFQEKTGVPTKLIDNTIQYESTPKEYFATHETPSAELLIWEQVERKIVDDAFAQQQQSHKRDIESLLPKRIINSRPYHGYARIRSVVFNPEPTLYLFQNARGMRRVFEQLYTLRFHLAHDISPRTPEYNLQSHMVFYDVEIKNARRPLSDEDIQHMADRIQKEIARVQAAEGIDVLYMPLPSKYTLYRDELEDSSYNQLLPRLIPELRKRNVPVVDLLPLFEQAKQQSPKLLYYPTDTHWAPRAKKIALKEVLRVLKEQGSLPTP